MNTTLVTLRLIHEECIHCHATFGITDDARDRFKMNHNSFYCPYCKGGMCYPGKSDKEKLEEQLALERRIGDNLKMEIRSLSTDVTILKHQVRGEKAAKTRIKNRVKNGVCPCCNRTFQNLMSHMQTQHPDYSKKE